MAAQTTLAVQRAVRFRAFLASTILALSASTCRGSEVDTLQSLGARIKLVADSAESGQSVDPSEIKRLEHALDDFSRSTALHNSGALEAKHDAVGRLLAKLELLSAKHSETMVLPTAASKSRHPALPIDVETVTDHHGSACSNALGLGTATPVAVTLASNGRGRNDAWFRFQGAVGGQFWFRTNSNGPDPALEVSRSCQSAPIASNDDFLGLDAAVSFKASEAGTLYVHVRNSGPSGSILLGVESADGTITGKITDAESSDLLAGAQVSANSIGGPFFSQYYGAVDQDGNYSIPVPPGSYYVEAGSYGYVTQLYPNVACRAGTSYYSFIGCPTMGASAVAVANGATVVGIDFALNQGQQILGQIRSTTNQPLAGSATLADISGPPLVFVNTDSVGRYAFQTLPPGQYKVSAVAAGYGSQLYAGIACGGALQDTCDFGQGASISLTDHDVLGIDFSLPQLAAIHGTITDVNEQPLSGQTQVTVLDAGGARVSQSYTSDAYGHYQVGPLGTGNYTIYVDSPGYFSQLFDGIDCKQDCSADTTGATTVTINQTGDQKQADFFLRPLPIVHGHVEDSSTHVPLPGVRILAGGNPPATFQQIEGTTTDANGDYVLDSIPVGKYYLWALSADHIDQVYPELPCEAVGNPTFSPHAVCDVSGAVLLTIAPDKTPTAFDFALPASATIKGSAIIRAGAGSDLPAAVGITVFDGSGSTVAYSNTDALGHFVVNDLAPGTYFVASSTFYGVNLIQQVWQLIDCPNTCAPTTGTAVPLAQGATVEGIDFALVLRNGIVGRVTDTNGAPIGGAIVDLFKTYDGTYRSSGVSDVAGYYAAVADFDNYFVATEAGNGYVDQLYAGLACPAGPVYYGLCALSGATSVTVNSLSTQPRIVNFALKSNDPIFANGFELP